MNGRVANSVTIKLRTNYVYALAIEVCASLDAGIGVADWEFAALFARPVVGTTLRTLSKTLFRVPCCKQAEWTVSDSLEPALTRKGMSEG
jgi:hypothetical protein